MQLSLSDEQKILKDSAEKFFNDTFTFEIRRNNLLEGSHNNQNIIKRMPDLGWFGLPFPNKLGGYDGSITDIMLLMECFGGALSLYPYITNILFTGKFIEYTLNDDLKNKFIPKIASGELPVTFAFAEPEQRFDHTNIETLPYCQKDSVHC